MSEDTGETRWKGIADRLVGSHVHLLVEPAGEDALRQMIKDSNVGKLRGTVSNSHFGIIANIRLSGSAGR